MIETEDPIYAIHLVEYGSHWKWMGIAPIVKVAEGAVDKKYKRRATVQKFVE